MPLRITLLGLLMVAATPLSTFAQQTPQNPVIIVPGIGASWNWDVMFSSLAIDDDWDFLAGVQQYDNLIQAFQDEGLVENQDFYVAFYDWRLPNNQSAQDYLVPIIDRALADNGASKVDIVAHSMGGLVTRAYLQSDGYRGDVDDFIMLGTPNYGSSDIYPLWEGGEVPENWDPDQKKWIKAYSWYLNFSFVNSNSDIYETVHDQILSVGELMPTYDFVFNKDEGATTTAADMQEQNVFLQALNTISTNELVGIVGTLTNIVGTGTSTVGVIPVADFDPATAEEEKLWVDGIPEPMPPARNDSAGDNRVLVTSALLPEPEPPVVSGEQKRTPHFARAFGATAYAQFFPGPGEFDQLELATTHGNLPTAAIGDIFGKLGLDQPTQTYADYVPPEHVATFLFASPVEVKITDPNGRSITKDSNNIPGAEYDGESDPAGKKMVIIQDAMPGEYALELTGLHEGGEFHFAIGHFGEGDDVMTTIQDAIEPNETIGYLIDYQPSATATEPVLISEPFDPDNRTPLVMLDDLIADIGVYADEGNIQPKGIAQALISDLKTIQKHLERSAFGRKENGGSSWWDKAQGEFFERLAITQLDRFIGKTSIFAEQGHITPSAAQDIINKTQRIVDAVRNE